MNSGFWYYFWKILLIDGFAHKIFQLLLEIKTIIKSKKKFDARIVGDFAMIITLSYRLKFRFKVRFLLNLAKVGTQQMATYWYERV